MWTVKEWLVGGLSVKILQKKTHLHENKHDGRHIYVEMQNQDNNNQDKRNYNLRTHIEINGNSTYEHDMDTKTKNKDTQRYVENHNPEYD